MTSNKQRGITLVETLVALAVMGFLITAMLAMVSQNIRFAGIMQDRTLAAIAADNRMVEALSLPDTFKLGERDGDIEVAGRTMRYQQVTTETGVNGVIRVDISIFAENSEQVLARATSMRRAQ